MASKRRIRRKSCSYKVRYATRPEVEHVMSQVIHSGHRRGGWLHVYPCQFCNGFHFGHASRGHK